MEYPRSGSSSTVSRQNWNLEMLALVEGGKPENPAKNPWSREGNQKQTRPSYGINFGIRTQATLVGGEANFPFIKKRCHKFVPSLVTKPVRMADAISYRVNGEFPPRSNVSGSFSFYFATFHSPWSGNMSKDIYNSCWEKMYSHFSHLNGFLYF